MDKKTIQKQRMMSYFIEAANNIIEKEGIHAITIRKVADLAGYNSATLYNYFENLDHLIFFASMKYLKDYVIELPHILKGAKNSLDKFFRIWERFCHYSFSNPSIYHTIFFDRFSNSVKDTVKEYYEIFPEELGKQSEDLLSMLLKQNIYQRNIALLESCAKEGFIKNEDISDINEMIVLIFQGMLSRIVNKQVSYTVDEAVKKTLVYFNQIIKTYVNNSLES